MTPEEIATLRRMATTAGLVSITGKELSTLLLAHDHHAAEAKALREAARAFLAAADDPDGDHVRHCICCARIAVWTRTTHSGHGRCDDCATKGDFDLVSYAAPLRALRALLEAP
jgi:hypothetical protein